MAKPVNEVPGPNLLLDLPGPAFAALWFSLSSDAKRCFFKVSKEVRERALNSARGAAYSAPLSTGTVLPALLFALLRRPKPLKFLELGHLSSCNFVGVDDRLHQLLHGLLDPHCGSPAPAAAAVPWQGAAGLRELQLMNVDISAEAAPLLPQAFPQLTSLRLLHCKHHTADLLRALRSCKHLTHLALVDPWHLDQEGLWAAAEAEAEAAGHKDLLHAIASQQPPQPNDLWSAAAATGLLLGRIPNLMSLVLDVPRVLSAFRMMTLNGLGSRLAHLSLTEKDTPYSDSHASSLLRPALQACSSITSLELAPCVGRLLPSLLPSSPGLLAKLRSLSLYGQTVELGMLDFILRELPALEHLKVKEFGGLGESRADASCTWRSLETTSGCMDLQALAHLPLHSLNQPITLGGRKQKLTCGVPGDDSDDEAGMGMEEGDALNPAQAAAAALVQAACANLARCRPGIYASKLAVQAHVRVPSMLRLLAFVHGTQSLCLKLPGMGPEELGCLAGAGSFTSGVQELEVAPSELRPGFLTPGLWAALPGLHTVELHGRRPIQIPVAELVQCFSAAPRPMTLKGMGEIDKGLREELLAQLAALPGGRVRVQGAGQ